MTPEEIKKAIEFAIDKKDFIPIWSYIAFFIISLLASSIAPYLKKKTENVAENEDFKDTLKRIEEQVNSVKAIEEQISHVYLEEREIIRLKREKIELIYESISSDIEVIGSNLSTAVSCMKRDQLFPSNKTQMLISLYFKNEIGIVLNEYLEDRKKIITHIKNIEEGNFHRNNQQLSMAENTKNIQQGQNLFFNLVKSKNRIEVCLEELMKNLTSRSSIAPPP